MRPDFSFAECVLARHGNEWCEEDGPVLWWTNPVSEPPYCGTPLDCDWPGYHTHWTKLLIPKGFDLPKPREAAPRHSEMMARELAAIDRYVEQSSTAFDRKVREDERDRFIRSLSKKANPDLKATTAGAVGTQRSGVNQK